MCDRVIDGDTFTGSLRIDPLNISIFGQRFRLYGVDTPERGDELYEEATVFAANLIENREITVSVYGRDSFGRLLTVVYLEDGTLNEKLLAAKLAVPFNRK